MPRPDADLQSILTFGAVAALDDAALLGLFESREAAADHAFEVLVRRHGSMVLRVARGRLDSEEDARDAFQATFWLLARRSRSIRNRTALAGWLFGVASRVAARANVEAARRRARERRVATSEADSTTDPARRADPDLAPTIQAEVARLPRLYRLAVILCDLEGLSYEEAAHRLDCPLGTFKARLSRGRSRLRARLARRGLAPAGWESAPSRSLIVPLALIQTTCRLVLSSTPPAGPPAAVLSVLTLAQGVSRTMILSKITLWAAVALLSLAVTVGVATVAEELATPAAPGPAPTGPLAAPAGVKPSLVRSNPDPNRRPELPALPPVTPLPPVYEEAFRQALLAAEAIADPTDQTEKLIWIARSQSRLGDRAGARATLAKAMAVIGGAAPGLNWVEPHPILRVATAQALNGDRVEAHQTFERAIPVITALPLLAQSDSFLNGVPDQQKVESRTESLPMIEAYRVHLDRKQEANPNPVYRWDLEVKLRALAGDFSGALALSRKPPEAFNLDLRDQAIGAAITVAEALLPGDPPGFIDATLADVRQRVLDQSGPRGNSKYLIELMRKMIKLGRFAAADELASHFEPPVALPAKIYSPLFNEAMVFDDLAEARQPSEPAQAARSARQAIEIVRHLPGFSRRAFPLFRAITVLAVVGEDNEALPIVEGLLPGLLSVDLIKPIVRTLQEQGKEAAARRWIKAVLDRNQFLLAKAREDNLPNPLVGYLQLERLELEWMNGDRPLDSAAIGELPADEHGRAWKALVGLVLRSGRVADALELAKQPTDPGLRHDLTIQIGSSLPIPALPRAESLTQSAINP